MKTNSPKTNFDIDEVLKEFEEDFGRGIDMDGFIRGGANDASPLDYDDLKDFIKKAYSQGLEAGKKEVIEQLHHEAFDSGGTTVQIGQLLRLRVGILYDSLATNGDMKSEEKEDI